MKVLAVLFALSTIFLISPAVVAQEKGVDTQSQRSATAEATRTRA